MNDFLNFAFNKRVHSFNLSFVSIVNFVIRFSLFVNLFVYHVKIVSLKHVQRFSRIHCFDIFDDDQIVDTIDEHVNVTKINIFCKMNDRFVDMNWLIVIEEIKKFYVNCISTSDIARSKNDILIEWLKVVWRILLIWLILLILLRRVALHVIVNDVIDNCLQIRSIK